MRIIRPVKFAIYIFIFWSWGNTVNAQGSGQLFDLPMVTPPSPNAASLGKYGDIPVSLYTGVPNINIPLYSIKVGDYSLPISLSYHSQGLKVEEQSGWVGLGWSLNAGGAITRTAHGLADEGNGGYWGQYNFTNDSIASSETLAESFCQGSLDLQPDIFTYNFAGKAGKFVFDNTASHSVHFIPYGNYKVATSGVLSQISITDDDGIIYIFGNTETTTDDNSPPTIFYYTSAWYLTKIVTPYGNINFTYTSESTSSVQRTEMDYLNTAASVNNEFNPGSYTFERYLNHSSIILSSISFPTGSISFSATPNRKDMSGASSISGFTVKDVKNNIVKKISLYQSYFGNTGSSSPGDVRLKLDSVVDINLTTSTQSKSYSFAYNNPSQVPSITSLSQDYWGYYNGASNTSLLPFIDPTIYGPYIANQASRYGNRNPSSSLSLIGTLTSIKYPTGGSTNFIYEGNDYGNVGAQLNNDTLRTETQIGASAKISGSTNIPIATTDFSINSMQTIAINISGSYSSPPPLENGPSIVVNLINSNGSRTVVFQQSMIDAANSSYPPNLAVGNYELIASVDGSNQTVTATVGYYIEGTSVVKNYPCGGLRIRQIINVDSISDNQNIKTYHYLTANDTTRSSGGLITAPQLTEPETSFYYGQSFLVRSASSCNYLGYTQGSHVGYSTVAESDSGQISNGKTVSSFTGCLSYPNQYSNLYIIRTQGEYQAYNPPHSLRYSTDFDVFRGLPTEEDIYNSNNIILRKHVINYNLPTATGTTSANYFQLTSKAGFFYNICANTCDACTGDDVAEKPGQPSWGDGGICTDYSLKNLSIADSYIACPWIYKTSTVDSNYDINGKNPVSNNRALFYDNPVHALLTRVISVNSRGDTLMTLNKYAGDAGQISGLSANANASLDSLISYNKISSAIEVDNYNNDTLLNLTRIDYNVWNALKHIVEPQHIYNQVMSNSAEDRMDFYQYDTSGNILEVGKSSDIHKSYIWDYNLSYPIAEVRGASQADIAYSSFEADGQGNWSIPDTSRNRLSGGITGALAYRLTGSNPITKSGLNSATVYVVGFWVDSSGIVSVNGSTSLASTKITLGSWTYKEALVTGATTVTIGGSGVTIDELRLYPKGAHMNTYTYAPLIGVTSICDPSCRLTYYTYDGLGRLKLIKDQYGNIIKRYDYEYQSTNQ